MARYRIEAANVKINLTRGDFIESNANYHHFISANLVSTVELNTSTLPDAVMHLPIAQTIQTKKVWRPMKHE